MLKWILTGLLLGLTLCVSIGDIKDNSPQDPVVIDFEVFDTDRDGRLSDNELIELFDHKVWIDRFSSNRT